MQRTVRGRHRPEIDLDTSSRRWLDGGYGNRHNIAHHDRDAHTGSLTHTRIATRTYVRRIDTTGQRMYRGHTATTPVRWSVNPER